MTTETKPKAEYKVLLRRPHQRQQEIIDSTAKRKVVRAGRRSGKTVVAAIMALQASLAVR